MNVVWVHRLGPELASYRYRAQIPAEEVAKVGGFKTALNNGEADIVVYSKPILDDCDAAQKAKAEGAKVIFDVTDDHFNDSEAVLYRRMSALADGIVCPSTVMRGRIFDYTKRDSVVIPDPYEQPECAPHADGDSFLWFGHMRNFREIKGVFKFLEGRKLRIVSGPKPMPQVIPWSLENLKTAFAMSNIVLLPTVAGNENKTPNRLLNAIRAGCFPICMTHPAYLEFKHMAWVGHFPTGLKWVDVFRSDLNALVAQAQDYIRDRYSPQAIGAQWATFLQAVK